MEKRYKIAIVGCGTAGAAAAIFLKRLGHDVRMFEKIEEPKPVGAGILMQPTGLEVLFELDLLPSIRGLGARVDRLYGETKRGRPILDIGYADIDPDAYGIGIHRGALFMELFNAVQKENVQIECGVEIKTLDERQDSVVLEDEKGKSRGMYDMVVVANGARSELRNQLRVRSQILPYPWGAIWHIADEPKTGPLVGGTVLAQVYDSTKKMLGHLPTGYATQNKETKLTSLFWSIEMRTVDLWRERGLNAWRDEVLSLSPDSEPLLARVSDLEELQVAGYHDVRMEKWNTNRVVVLGDAGHAMSPQLGQGANLALADARALRDAMQKGATIREKLQNYSESRRAHLRYYQFSSRWLTPVFQSKWGVLSWPRDTVFEPISRLPFVRRQMVESLLGVKTGLFSRIQYRSLPLLLGKDPS